MKKLLLVTILFCSTVGISLYAQNKKPFITYYLSDLQTAKKDSAGKWSEWEKEKIKTIVVDVFLYDVNDASGSPDDNKVNLYYFKGKKQVEAFTYKHTDYKEDNGYTILILTEARNSAGKPCTIEFKRSTDRSTQKLKELGVWTIKYNDELMEYTGVTL